MSGSIGMRNSSSNPDKSTFKHNAFLALRIGVAFVGYIAIMALCLVLNPNENNFPLMALCSCATTIATVSLCVACLDVFVKMNKAIRDERNAGDTTGASNATAETAQTQEESKSADGVLVKEEDHLSIGKKIGLTKREMEVFSLLLEGKNARDIETSLCISRYTAKTHIGSVYRKADVHSQQELIESFNQETSHA